MPRRPDAELVKTSKFNELMFHFMLKRNESAIYFDIQVDLTYTFEFLEKFNKGRDEKEPSKGQNRCEWTVFGAIPR